MRFGFGKGFLLLAALVALPLLFAAACGGDDDNSTATTPAVAAPTGAPIRIACICDQTGALASNGRSVSEGATLAVSRINAAGGVLGRPLELKVYDDQSAPARATQLFLRAVQEDGIVAAVMGGSSAVSLAVLPDAQKAGTALVLANQQSPKLTDPVNDYAYRVTMSSARWSLELVPFIKSQGWKKVGIFYRDDAFGQGGRDNSRTAFGPGSGLELVGEAALQPDGTDFTAQAQKLRDAKPDVLVSWAFPNESIVFMNNVRTIGWTGVGVVGNQGWGVPEVVRSPALDGVFYPDLVDTSRSDVQSELAEYQQRFNRDGTNAYNVQGYDGAQMIAKAIKDAGSADPAAIVAKMKNLRYDTIEGSDGSYIQYSPTNHDGPANDKKGTPVVFVQVKGGKAQAFSWTKPSP